MKIGELAKRAGMTTHTIRYYERIGLLPYADRDGSSRRDYDVSILVWIQFLGRMKMAGMPIREMLRYATLREQGSGTEAERRELLEKHRKRVRIQIAELNDCLLVLDTKISAYVDTEKRIEDYDEKIPERRRKPAGARQTRTR